MKRLRPGDQREHWICSGLLFAEDEFRRIDGYRELPRFMDILDARLNSSKVARTTALIKLALEAVVNNKESDVSRMRLSNVVLAQEPL